MGTDIHFYVEHRAPGGAWVWDEPTTEDDGYVSVVDPFYSGRSYSTFAILADVRNGTGFAGVRTGAGFEPVSPPKGLPEDLSPTLRAHMAEYSGDHTPSWLTLAEIMAYDWCRVSTHAGYLSLRTWARRREFKIDPDEWCSEVSGPSVKKLTPADAALLAAKVDMLKLARGDEGTLARATELAGGTDVRFTRVYDEWPVRYTEAASDFLANTVPRLWRLGAPDDVRCVFNFDS